MTRARTWKLSGSSNVARWHSVIEPQLFAPLSESLFEQITNPDRSQQVLNVRCRTGEVARRLGGLMPEARIVAVDDDDALLDSAREEREDARIFFKREDLSALSFGAASFDTSVLVLGDDTLLGPHQVFSELFRVTAPGGHLHIATLRARGCDALFEMLDEVARRDGDLQLRQRIADLERTRERALVQAVEAEGFGSLAIREISVSLPFDSAGRIADDPFLRATLLHRLGLLADDQDRGCVRRAIDSLSTYTDHKPLTLELQAFVLNARR